MSDERNPHESTEEEGRPAAEEVEDLEVSSDLAEDVKGGMSDFKITKKFDKSSPSIG